MSCPEAGIRNSRHLAAFRLLVTTSFALLLLAIGGAWSPARAVGPALWIASPRDTSNTSSLGGLIEVRPFWLLSSGAPHRVNILEPNGHPLAGAAGIAAQPNGGLWVVTLNNTLWKLTQAQLENLSIHPHPRPAVKITSSSAFGFIIGCQFDAHVNLWVVDGLNDAVHEISHAQLAAGTADVVPQVTITDNSDLASPAFATFDTGGNIWISSEGNNKIVEFTADQLTTSGTPVPHVIISSPSLDEPGQLQFDNSGNLWVTNAGTTPAAGNSVVAFTPSQLAASGSPAATIVLHDDGAGSLDTPWGLQFDALNRLWVSNYSSGTIVRFGLGQLSASGSPTPRIILTKLPLFAGQITFGPRY